jgi:hypothetical protein
VIENGLVLLFQRFPLVGNDARQVTKTNFPMRLSMTPLFGALGENGFNTTDGFFWCRFFGIALDDSRSGVFWK